VIDRLAPYAKNYAGPHPGLGIGDASQVVAIATVIDRVPPELIGTLPGPDYADLIIRLTTVREFAKTARRRGAAVQPMSGEHVVALRQLLERCPDTIPSPATASLTFVHDPVLRESLRIDISAANHDLANGEWKSATVMAASVVEALLLDALQKQHPNAIAGVRPGVIARGINVPNTPLDEWTLRPFIEIALDLQLIEARTAIQTRQAADYRNLIHPGRAQRLGAQCNRGTALAAMSALEFVVEDLTP